MSTKARVSWTLMLLMAGNIDLAVAQVPSPTTQLAPVAEIKSVKAAASGLTVNVVFAHVGYIGAFVDRQNEGTGNFESVVDGMVIPLPGELNQTPDNVQGDIVFPLVLTGKGATYRLTLYVKTRRDDTVSPYTYSTPLTFRGFDASVKQITNAINLQFSQDNLTISAQTDDKVTLKASWVVAANGTPFGLQAVQDMQNPKVQLSYGDLPKNSAGGFPAMDIALSDRSGLLLQEAKVSIAVVSSKDVTNKVNSVKDQPTSSSKSSSTKFSWSDLAKTGLGAVMKYFTAGI